MQLTKEPVRPSSKAKEKQAKKEAKVPKAKSRQDRPATKWEKALARPTLPQASKPAWKAQNRSKGHKIQSKSNPIRNSQGVAPEIQPFLKGADWKETTRRRIMMALALSLARMPQILNMPKKQLIWCWTN